MKFSIDGLVRPNISSLVPYSSARSEFSGEAEIYLDANENNFGSAAENGLNRYPDPLQRALRKSIAKYYRIAEDWVFLGNGSDEAIDLLYRIFCRPGVDEAIVCPPTYGMYETAASINDVRLREVPLDAEFQIDVAGVLQSLNTLTRLVFFCSPNNPTGNLMRREDIITISRSARCIVVVDEAYIDFADCPSLISEISEIPNLVVLRTLSKAFGCAGLRIGIAIAAPQLIRLLNAVKPPYNIATPNARLAINALQEQDTVRKWVREIVSERIALADELSTCRCVETVFPSDANFLLVRFRDSAAVYKFLLSRGIVTRDRSQLPGCRNCLRISVGTPEENVALLQAINEFDCL